MFLAASVPDNFDSAKKRGLDVKAWGREDLIEIFISGLGDDLFYLPVEEFIKFE